MPEQGTPLNDVEFLVFDNAFWGTSLA